MSLEAVQRHERKQQHCCFCRETGEKKECEEEEVLMTSPALWRALHEKAQVYGTPVAESRSAPRDFNANGPVRNSDSFLIFGFCHR